MNRHRAPKNLHVRKARSMNRRSLAALAAIIPLCACGPSHDETPKINTYALDDDAALSCVPIDASSPEASPDVASDVPQDPRATTGEWDGVPVFSAWVVDPEEPT